MTIEQTVEIPASRKIMLDLPEETPIGTAQATIKLKFSASNEPEGISSREFVRRMWGESYKKPEMKPLAPGEKWVNPILGIAKDTNLTLERWSEIQREDIEIENENDRRMWGRNE
ncbi:MAG: hypothetical protein LBG72_02380 [Spirochaetaceae bacterium]|jgi:hypothetical protein|nr:hypothetical protein [Spirochaetaceae bacterium]